MTPRREAEAGNSEQRRVRAFFAVDLTDSVRQRLVEQVAELQQASWARSVRWVRSETLHLTLRFLGDIDAASVAALSDRARAEAASLSPFEIVIDGIEFFPSRRRARVVAARLVAGGDALAAVAAAVERAVVAEGFEEDRRPFRAHVTLGRVRGGLDELPESLPTGEGLAMPVTAFLLQRSILSAKGSTYRQLARVEL